MVKRKLTGPLPEHVRRTLQKRRERLKRESDEEETNIQTKDSTKEDVTNSKDEKLDNAIIQVTGNKEIPELKNKITELEKEVEKWEDEVGEMWSQAEPDEMKIRDLNEKIRSSVMELTELKRELSSLRTKYKEMIEKGNELDRDIRSAG
ncbi:MAG: hypothetical protein GF349_01185 [Candidatus Magasanikbacteria bacterium]|nr:hypothetical protein [Candidatus Magasanikbacteria bacterium]